jgi:hypothetical protein
MYQTGKWRREVIRRHPDTASLRYLAPPAAAIVVASGIIVGVLGSATGYRLLRAGFLAPAGYLALIAGGSLTAGPMSAGARLRLPIVLVATHMAWGIGFLVGLGKRSEQIDICLNK